MQNTINQDPKQAQIVTMVTADLVGDFPHNALERSLPYEQLSGLLVLADLPATYRKSC